MGRLGNLWTGIWRQVPRHEPAPPTVAVGAGVVPLEGTFPHWSRGFEAALEQRKFAERRPALALRVGEARSRQRGRALEFADYRPYVPGDDPKVIDWRAYARLDRLYVKQYDEERGRTYSVLIDASASMDHGAGATHKGLYARRLACALAWIAQGRGDLVQTGLLRNGQADRWPPVAARAGLAALVRRLVSVREAGETELARAVQASLGEASAGPTFLLSDLLDASWEEALGRLAATGEATVIQILSPEEWEPPLGAEVELEDAESGEVRAIRLGPPELAAYRSRRDAHQHAIRETCRRQGVVFVAVNTAVPLQHVVLHDLAAAGVVM